MRQVFEKIKAECAICGTPLNGTDLLKRGDKYYCPSDFEKTSAQEKAANKRKIKQINDYKKLF